MTPVRVEVLRLAPVHGVLRWTATHGLLPHGTEPDALARGLAGGLPDAAALHSTSWRAADGVVVLTYALFPAPGADDGWEPLAQHVVTGADAVHPSPEHVAARHVAAHAARHLADLAGGRDPHLVRCAALDPGAWTLLREHAATVHVHLPAAVVG